jgi:hypothetical protein
MESAYQKRVSMSCNGPDSAKENKSNQNKSEISLLLKKIRHKIISRFL